jgi:hypothetical protein
MERMMFTEAQRKEVLTRAQERREQIFDSIPAYSQQRIALVKRQPTPATRRQFHIDNYGFLYVDLLPDGRKLWVAKWPGNKGSGKRHQCVLGNFNELSYNQASWLEDAALYPV